MAVSALLRRAAPAAVVTLVLAAATTACGTSAGGSAPQASEVASVVDGSSRATGATPRVTKVLTFMVENHSLAQMRAQMPFTYGLATRYAYADDYHAITHPSLPNYLAIVGGSTFGIADDRPPGAHRLRGTTVFDTALARHKTAKTYGDSMGSNCQLAAGGRYAVKHNPWAYFVDGRAGCGRYDVPVSALARDAANGTLPVVGMVVPDLVHDAHDASLATADAWIRSQVQRIQRGPDWNSGRLAIVITADEDDRASGNKVLAVVASRFQSHRVVHTRLDHYSLTRLYGSVTGAYVGRAASAASMGSAFGINTPYGS